MKASIFTIALNQSILFINILYFRYFIITPITDVFMTPITNVLMTPITDVFITPITDVFITPITKDQNYYENLIDKIKQTVDAMNVS